MIVQKYKTYTVFKSDKYGTLFVMINYTGHISTNKTEKTIKVNQYLKQSNLDILNSEEDMFLFKIFLESL
jgi:hypothetical protein